jgi:hypothetical protein
LSGVMHELAEQFQGALSLIEISDERRCYAAEAHAEIRSFLEGDEQLRTWGVDTALIGSYARKTGIHPGKDVDVFTKLTKLAVEDTDPGTIFEAVRKILVEEYQGRAEPQNRSVKIDFERDGFEFSVDVVPAVRLNSRWAIPRRNREVWDQPDERWVETNPEYLGELTTKLNDKLKVGSQGAYVPNWYHVGTTAHPLGQGGKKKTSR